MNNPALPVQALSHSGVLANKHPATTREKKKKKKGASSDSNCIRGKKKQASDFANNKTHLPSLYVLSPFLYSIIVDVTILSYLHETHHHIRFEQNVHPIMLFVTVLFCLLFRTVNKKCIANSIVFFSIFFPFWFYCFLFCVSD